MKVTLQFNFTDEQRNALAKLAMRHGFVRTNKDAGWTEQELKYAAKFAVKKLVGEQLPGHAATVTNHCTGFVGYEQVPCKAYMTGDGEVHGNCGEPCRWIMRKAGEGKPPFRD